MLPSNREVVDEFVAAWEDYEPNCGLLDALIDFIHEVYGIEVSPGAFDLERLPHSLHLRFEIVDDRGKNVGSSIDLTLLQTQLADRVRDRFTEVSKGRFEKARISSWSFGDLPKTVALDRHTSGFPGLHDGAALHIELDVLQTRVKTLQVARGILHEQLGFAQFGLNQAYAVFVDVLHAIVLGPAIAAGQISR